MDGMCSDTATYAFYVVGGAVSRGQYDMCRHRTISVAIHKMRSRRPPLLSTPAHQHDRRSYEKLYTLHTYHIACQAYRFGGSGLVELAGRTCPVTVGDGYWADGWYTLGFRTHIWTDCAWLSQHALSTYSGVLFRVVISIYVAIVQLMSLFAKCVPVGRQRSVLLPISSTLRVIGNCTHYTPTI